MIYGMGRSRYAVSIGEEMPLGYKIYEPTHPHFVTCTVLHWLPLFTNRDSATLGSGNKPKIKP
jgi:hypothetical protein